jgi:hypothetical protein
MQGQRQKSIITKQAARRRGAPDGKQPVDGEGVVAVAGCNQHQPGCNRHRLANGHSGTVISVLNRSLLLTIAIWDSYPMLLGLKSRNHSDDACLAPPPPGSRAKLNHSPPLKSLACLNNMPLE